MTTAEPLWLQKPVTARTKTITIELMISERGTMTTDPWWLQEITRTMKIIRKALRTLKGTIQIIRFDQLP